MTLVSKNTSRPSKRQVPVVDLFAGPGGLGEGFSAFRTARGRAPFGVRLSIEKDRDAHQTLTLRSFFRQFTWRSVPEEYYAFLREPGPKALQDLYETHGKEARQAASEAKRATLGEEPSEEVDRWIRRGVGKIDSWVLLGGPPCQAYSTVGRSRNKGIKGYNAVDDQRHYLYEEYLRILATHWPPVFVMENVTGLLSSKVNGESMFERIIEDLSSPGRNHGRGMESKHRYKICSLVVPEEPAGSGLTPASFIVRAEDYGVPQARHRVILLGLRLDLGDVSVPTLQARPEISTEMALDGLPALRSGLSKEPDSGELWVRCLQSLRATDWFRGLKASDLAKVHDKMTGVLSSLSVPDCGRGGEFVPSQSHTRFQPEDWLLDSRIGGACNHIARIHIAEDLHRYLFASCYAATSTRNLLKNSNLHIRAFR
jgi:DNA (cytosine-5)-methyltransferase 1